MANISPLTGTFVWSNKLCKNQKIISENNKATSQHMLHRSKENPWEKSVASSKKKNRSNSTLTKTCQWAWRCPEVFSFFSIFFKYFFNPSNPSFSLYIVWQTFWLNITHGCLWNGQADACVCSTSHSANILLTYWYCCSEWHWCIALILGNASPASAWSGSETFCPQMCRRWGWSKSKCR